MANSIPVSKRMSCAGCGGFMWKSRTSLPEGMARCRECRRVHGASAVYKNGCRCKVCRNAQAARMREYAARRKAQGAPLHKGRRTVDRECVRCGESFAARIDAVKAGKGKFCSLECHNEGQVRSSGRNASRREYQRIHGKRGSVRWRAQRRANAALSLNGGNRVLVQGPCIVCGSQFIGVGAAARYCSDVCAERNSKDNFGIRWLDRMALYARDNWQCHLCGLPVDPSLDDRDDGAASLDHVVPQSRGGGHEFENLRLSHRLCNSVRRDIPLEEFLTEETMADLRERLGVSYVAR